MVLIQRCYLRPIVETVRKVCDYLNIPLVFETDDDYLNIPHDNPAHLSMIPPQIIEGLQIKLNEEIGKNKDNPEKINELQNEFRTAIEVFRQEGLQNYKEIISMMDMVIVSTEEIKRTLYPFNKNIVVLQNNLLELPAWRSYDPEQAFINPQTGVIEIKNNQGMVSIPAYVAGEEGKITPTPRIGYTSTVTHWGQDFNSIMGGWQNVIDKFSDHCWFIYIGWDRFVNWHMHYAGYKIAQYKDEQTGETKATWIPDSERRQLPRRVFHIPDSMFDLYMYHIRNLDIGIAPLSPNVFNLSKSDIKAVEYGAWGIPAVLPRLQTYQRNWVDGENCLMYTGNKEFEECISTLITDHNLRNKLGMKAHEYVRNNRLEKQHSEKRYKTYREIIESKNRLCKFSPEPNNA